MNRSAMSRALGRSRKGLSLTAVAAAALLALSACSGGGAPPTEPQNQGGSGGGGGAGITIAMVTHEPPGDTFWTKVQNGARQAAKDTGVTLKYSADPDSGKQATLVQSAIDSKVNGIATTLANPEAMAGVVKGAGDAGIPVVALNAGLDQYQKLGALMYFGSDEAVAGEAGGKRLAALGAKHVLCPIQAAGVVSLDTRCAGIKKAVPNTETVQVNGQDDSAVTSALQAKLSQDKSIDYIVTLGAPIALDALKAMDGSGTSAKLATFDMNTEVAQNIKDGKILFSIDQQPYVQGYMSVVALYLNAKNGNDLGGGKAVLTGPSFVDNTNIDKVLEYAKNNTR
jgi:simple sugar transport system substrate-binding protein